VQTTSDSRNHHQRRSDVSTRRLLEAAGELIVEGGYRSMTLVGVGERAGYSRGLVTARFGSKGQLLSVLVDRIIKTWSHRNVQPRTKDSTGRERVRAVLEAIAAQAERDAKGLRVLYALMFEALGSVPELHETFVEFHRTMRADMARNVATGIKDGSIPEGVSPEMEAALIVGGLRGIAYQWRLDPEGFQPAPALRYLVQTTDDRLGGISRVAP
jgi:AcrR family transcriptional regulator